MNLHHLSLAVALILPLSYLGEVSAATHTPRTCGTEPGSVLEQTTGSASGIGGTGHGTVVPSSGIGGTGHENTIPPGGIGGTEHNVAAQSSGIGGTGHDTAIPPGGIGGTGHENTIPPGGIGGTGHEPSVPPGGIGGTGIVAAGTLMNVSGIITAEDFTKKQLRLADGDQICPGDKIATNQDAKAKIQFTDGAILHLLKNTEISLIDYNYSPQQPELSRSLITLAKGDIRSVSGKISKLNPQKYSFKTPSSTIRVIGTDFLVTHLLQQEGALDAGTYTKVISGEVSVQSTTSTIRLRAGESSHIMLNGTQSIISSGGGTCSVR